jgi:hypothetical protein
MQRKESKRKHNFNKEKNMKLLPAKKTPDMNGKKMHLKLIINVKTNMNMKKRIEANSTATMNMKVNMNENMNKQEFGQNLTTNVKENAKMKTNGNEMLLICLFTR